MDNAVLIYIVMVVSIVVSSLCSVLEATFLSIPMSFISGLEATRGEGDKLVGLLRDMKNNPQRPLTAILCINTIANTVGAALLGSLVAEVYGSALIGLFSVLFTFLILILSEILPKTLGSNHWRSLAVWAVKIIRLMIFMTYPLVKIFEYLTRLISREDSGARQVSVSRQDLSAMVEVSSEEGEIQKKENKMIQSLLHLNEITAREIMTPSVVVEMADSAMSLSEFYKTEKFNMYSRIPVYEEDKSDYITGYVLRQTILERLAEDKFNLCLKDLTRKILSFPENEPVANIWEKLLEKKEHISIIIDEYGALRGIVTMEDVIETMLGFEIVDEKDRVADMQAYAKEQWRKINKNDMDKGV